MCTIKIEITEVEGVVSGGTVYVRYRVAIGKVRKPMSNEMVPNWSEPQKGEVTPPYNGIVELHPRPSERSAPWRFKAPKCLDNGTTLEELCRQLVAEETTLQHRPNL